MHVCSHAACSRGSSAQCGAQHARVRDPGSAADVPQNQGKPSLTLPVRVAAAFILIMSLLLLLQSVVQFRLALTSYLEAAGLLPASGDSPSSTPDVGASESYKQGLCRFAA